MATRGSSAWSLSAARLAAVSWEDKGTPVRDARGGLARWVDRGVARRRWHRLLPACSSSVGRSRPISQGCLYPGVTTPGLRTPARVTMGSVNHSELAALLRSRRARIRLSDGVLSTGPRRRVPGLRREEVAKPTGLSADYCTELELGTGTRRPALGPGAGRSGPSVGSGRAAC